MEGRWRGDGGEMEGRCRGDGKKDTFNASLCCFSCSSVKFPPATTRTTFPTRLITPPCCSTRARSSSRWGTWSDVSSRTCRLGCTLPLSSTVVVELSGDPGADSQLRNGEHPPSSPLLPVLCISILVVLLLLLLGLLIELLLPLLYMKVVAFSPRLDPPDAELESTSSMEILGVDTTVSQRTMAARASPAHAIVSSSCAGRITATHAVVP